MADLPSKNERKTKREWKENEKSARIRVKHEKGRRMQTVRRKILILSPPSDCLPLQILLATDFQSSLLHLFQRPR